MWSLVMAVLVAFGGQLGRDHAQWDYVSTVLDSLPAAVRCDGDSEITPELLLSIAFVESRFEPTAEGRILRRFRDACESGQSEFCPRPIGIMQIVPGRWHGWSASSLRTARGGFAAGAWILKELRLNYGRDFLCMYGGARVCATQYENKVIAAKERLERALWHVTSNGQCVELDDAAYSAAGCAASGDITDIDCR